MPLRKIQGDINLYIRYLIESFHSLAESKKISLHFLPETEHLIMDYDPEKLMQILSNLISNAIKYSEHGGRVEILTLRTGEQKNRLEIQVRDNGMGIQEEHLPHIFDRFYRIEGSNRPVPGVSGSGLGLALTRELVKLLNGTIKADSIYGEGTVFIVSLPVTNSALLRGEAELFKIEKSIPQAIPVQDEKSKMQDELRLADNPQLLIVEDSQDVIEYLVALLDTSYHIHIAHDGKEGLKKALDLSPDIILSDVMMPEMDGIELLNKVKNDIRTSHIPVVILTAKADIASRLTGLERGADAYIAKPFDKKELIIQLNKSVRLREKLQERYATFGHLTEPQNKDFKIEDSFIQKIREFMLVHLVDRAFSVKKLCYEIAMSRAQLYRKFKTLTDKSLFDYFLSLRLHEARKLLATSGMNVSEVAYQTGFKSLSHFR
jgi:DNA-binding response OmpR family regulator/two-component sensor histidine kinase